jgi:hypothetical protein
VQRELDAIAAVRDRLDFIGAHLNQSHNAPSSTAGSGGASGATGGVFVCPNCKYKGRMI